MSSSLIWRPIAKDKSLGYRLKFYISESLWGHDGSLCGDWISITKDSIDLSYLRGVKDTTDDLELKKEIEKLESLLNKYGEIEISLVN
jgi:hypothetical protein